MKKKVLIGALIGAFVLLAAVASFASATGFGDSVSAGEVEQGTSGNGDCDKAQKQIRDRDMLRDGSCSDSDCDGVPDKDMERLMDSSCRECVGPVQMEETVMNQEMDQFQLMTQACDMNGADADPHAYQNQHMNQNGYA